jgi:hypothetical protein
MEVRKSQRSHKFAKQTMIASRLPFAAVRCPVLVRPFVFTGKNLFRITVITILSASLGVAHGRNINAIIFPLAIRNAKLTKIVRGPLHAAVRAFAHMNLCVLLEPKLPVIHVTKVQNALQASHVTMASASFAA